MDDKEEKCVSVNKNEVKNVLVYLHEFHFIYHINVESVELIHSLHLRPLSSLKLTPFIHTYDELTPPILHN